MSGHSHAKTVAHKKQIEGQKRGQAFSKLSQLIAIAAKEGKDPETNYKLRQALDAAKRFNMPKENVERAILRGTGGGADENLEEFRYEALGQGGVSMIIEGITDNKNRALLEVKQILQKHGARLADEGSLKWAFDRKGIIVINPNVQASNFKNKEDLEMMAIEAGAEDIKQAEENFLEVYTTPESLEKIRKEFENNGLKIDSISLAWISKEEISLSEKENASCESLFEELEESDSVQNVYSNLKS